VPACARDAKGLVPFRVCSLAGKNRSAAAPAAARQGAQIFRFKCQASHFWLLIVRSEKGLGVSFREEQAKGPGFPFQSFARRLSY